MTWVTRVSGVPVHSEEKESCVATDSMIIKSAVGARIYDYIIIYIVFVLFAKFPLLQDSKDPSQLPHIKAKL